MVRYTIPVQSYRDLLEAWQQFKEKAPFNVNFIEIRCKHCNSNQIIKYGLYKGVQLWWCQRCQRKFTGNNSFPGMKISIEHMQSALSLYFKGVPLGSIRKQMQEEFDYYPSNSTIYRWVHKTTEKVLEDTKDHHPQIGNVWIAYDSAITMNVKKYWVLDLIDVNTHFLLASRLSTNRNIEDIRTLVESALQRAHKTPEMIVTRRPSKYLKVLEQVLGLDSKRVKVMRPEKDFEMRFSVFWHYILDGRRTITRRLKSFKLIQLTLKGWVVNYNYYVPQKSLQWITPAQAAKLEYSYEAKS